MKKFQFGGGFKFKRGSRNVSPLKEQELIRNYLNMEEQSQIKQISSKLQAKGSGQLIKVKVDRPLTAIQRQEARSQSPVKKQFDDKKILLNDTMKTIIAKYCVRNSNSPQKVCINRSNSSKRITDNSSIDQLETVVNKLLKRRDHSGSQEKKQKEEVQVETKKIKCFKTERIFSQKNISCRPLTNASPKNYNQEETSLCGLNRYIFLNILGTGSYATVKLAQDQLTEKYLIHRYYLLDLLQQKHHQRKQCLLREINILKRLKHSCIIQLIDTIETPLQYHLVLEYGGTKSLRQYLKDKRRLHETEAKIIFYQLIMAISYCHLNFVVHRDIKLENILIFDEIGMQIKLIDFGFSVLVQKETKLQIYCGTPSYMAPEIVSRQEYLGQPVDIWSLGVLLYVIVSGQFPFKGKDDNELFSTIIKGKYQYPTVSIECQKLISKMLQVKPQDRVTAAEILQDEWLKL